MLSSNAVRHRTSNNSPTESNPSKALDVKSESGDSNASANGKLHGPKRRRDELLRSNKSLFVVAGAFSVLAMCVVGMWASSASIDGRRSARQLDKKAHLSPRKKTRKNRPAPERPRGIGRRKEEEMFLIPEERIPDQSIEVDEVHDKEEKVSETRKKVLPRSSKKASRKVGSEGSVKKQRHKESKNSDDDEDHDKYEEREDLSGEDPEFDLSGNEGGNTFSGEAGRPELPGDKKSKRSPFPLAIPINKANTGALGYQSQPRVLRLCFEEMTGDEKRSADEDKDTREDGVQFNFKNAILAKVQRIVTHESEDMASSERVVNPYPDDDEYFTGLADVKKSKKYRRTEREPLEDEECKPRYEWQKGAYPNCNILHEFELGQLSGMFGRALRGELNKREGEGDDIVKYLAHGYWRDVWVVSKADPFAEGGEELTVLKTLRYQHDFTDRNYERHRKDALASERLSGSDRVIDIFAYCSNTGLFEYGSGGDIEGKLWPYDEEKEKYYVTDIPSQEKLDMAYQVAAAIADVHDVEDEEFASIAHTDITPSQFIFINNKWKLNDFNRCRFMRVYKEDNSPCGFHVGANPGKFRAPEEYEYDEENEMVDVYSMGNIFYAILSGKMPFEGEKEAKAQKKVKEGRRPHFPEEVRESEDIAIRSIVSATKKCWTQEPDERPSAASIRDQLKKAMYKISEESGRLNGNKGKNATRKS